MNKFVFSFLFLLLPINSFSLGAALLKEFGDRPFNILLMILMVISFFLKFREWLNFELKKLEFLAFALIFSSVCISTIFFLFQQSESAVSGGSGRSPFYSFLAQLMVLVFSVLYIFFLKRFLQIKIDFLNENIGNIFFWVTIFHLIFFFVHVLTIQGIHLPVLEDFVKWLRVDDGTKRPSGLMTEPSYWGAFVAYAWPILFFCFKENDRMRWIGRVAAIVLIITAITIGARTLVVILMIQTLVLIFGSSAKRAYKVIFFMIAITVGILFLFMKTNIFSVSDNLSSAMRIGSTLLGVNVASKYGMVGIGVGQFNFYYRPEFAPNFLFLSAEASQIFDGLSEFRASTFNFFVRLVVELGILGLIGYILLIVAAARNILRIQSNSLRNGFFLAYFGALSFWLTQDSFIYSPAIFFIALGLGVQSVPHVVSKYKNSDVLIEK